MSMGNTVFMEIISNSLLNEMQLLAATHHTGPAVVYAGAGSGKTKVICSRIAWLIHEKKVRPSSILAVTFTNKAAKEMKERIEQMIGADARYLTVSTFHSFCARYLRIYAEKLGFDQNFSIFDDGDQKALLKEVLKNLDISDQLLSVATAKSKIDKIKNKGFTPKEYAEHLKHNSESIQYQKYDASFFRLQASPQVIQKVYEAYQKKLKSQNALDFNDLLLAMTSLLQEHPDVLSALQNRFKYFLIDEFQDTNPIQFKLISLLAGEFNNLFIVGDDDQSIYSWRGADPSFILNFTELFKNAKLFKLEQNYRSTKNIIHAAASVIKNNKNRAAKTLFTNNTSGSKIKIHETIDAPSEAEFIVREIYNNLDENKNFSDFAVLYRTNAQSRLIEDALRKKMIPYVIYGSVRFYERAEIKILISYLKTFINPKDDQSFLKIINTPRRGLGDTAIEKLTECANSIGEPLIHTATEIVYGNIETEHIRTLSKLKKLIMDIQVWKSMAAANEKAGTILQKIISDIRFEDYLRTTYPEDFDERILNILELKNGLSEFEEQYLVANTQSEQETTSEGSQKFTTFEIIAKFIEQAMLLIEPTKHNVQSGESNAVTLMTVHSAKGLEFPHVFIAGLEEGTFPHQNSLNSPDEIEEERRLMYVAMTRAKKHLTLSHSKRHRYKEFLPAQKSRFLSEIPNDCFDTPEKPKPRLAFGIYK
jgi:DNA helicase-2/ATP-dependent DNA helicase PcrA